MFSRTSFLVWCLEEEDVDEDDSSDEEETKEEEEEEQKAAAEDEKNDSEAPVHPKILRNISTVAIVRC